MKIEFGVPFEVPDPSVDREGFDAMADAIILALHGVDNVCDWYYSAPEDRPRVCPTCGEEFE